MCDAAVPSLPPGSGRLGRILDSSVRVLAAGALQRYLLTFGWHAAALSGPPCFRRVAFLF